LKACSTPFAAAVENDEYVIEEHPATDSDFIGVNGPSKAALTVHFHWALTDEILKSCTVKECSTLRDVYWNLRDKLPSGRGKLTLVHDNIIHSEAWVVEMCALVLRFIFHVHHNVDRLMCRNPSGQR
jgi:hypothetical protein